MGPQIIVASDEARLYKKTAELILSAASKAVKERGRFTFVLSGGSTPQRLFKLLSESYYKERLPWEKTDIFWGDERCVPPNHSDSNYKMAFDTLLSRVPIPEKNIYRMKGEMETSRVGAKDYEQTLRSYFKVTNSVPRFDLMLLGVGGDGHTASLFPKTDALKEENHFVTTNFVQRLNSHRITLTYPIINYSRLILFLVQGESKADVIKGIFKGFEGTPRYPSQGVRPTTGELVWLLDKKAAAKLPQDAQAKVVSC